MRSSWNRATRPVVAGLIVGIAAVAWLVSRRADDNRIATEASISQAAFVGTAMCAACHAREYAAWQGSHHQRAMQEADEQTVLGDFANARFSYAGVTSTFVQRTGAFLVDTDGPDGQLRAYPVKYTFGMTPLQQYLVEFPGGRLQALPFAWDSRPKASGGARWFHLYRDERIDHGDALHWTGREQNWNWMCADCHSTGLTRNYDAKTDSYKTTWSEINVSCEACHGPGSRHVAWAKWNTGVAEVADNGLAILLDERHGVSWRIDGDSGNAVRSRPRTSRREIDACGRCHSRRAAIADAAWRTELLDRYDPALLTDGLYFADGQQQGEVYEYASFLQSRMYAAGVTCSDCHDPHSGQLRAPGSGVCLQCHAAATYDAPMHTLHADATSGATCVACHMPARTYMVVDSRRDHSIRIPRPDLTVRFGVPNACAACHENKGPQWAAAALERRFGPPRPGTQRFFEALHAARTAAPEASRRLLTVIEDAGVPAIARATALDELGAVTHSATSAIERSARDPDPLVRSAAARALVSLDPAERLRIAEPLLEDPVRAVRIHAARALADVAVDALPPARRDRLQAGFEEYVASQRAAAERPEAHVNLGAFYSERGAPRDAEREYRIAIRLQPAFIAAYVNLADLYRTQGRERESETTLRDGLAHVPGDGDLAYALALARVRQGHRAEAIDLLRQAATKRPDNPQYAYVYAVALRDAGRPREALTVLESALTRFPGDPDLLFTGAMTAHEAGRREDARRHARALADAAPTDPRTAALMRELGLER